MADLRKLDSRLEKVQQLLEVPAIEGLREQQAQGKQKNIDYRTLYTDKKGPWWRHVSSDRQLEKWSQTTTGRCVGNFVNSPGKNTPASVFTGESVPLHDPPGSPQRVRRELPKREEYLQFALHGILAIQDVQSNTEVLYMRASFFRALEDVGLDLDPDHAPDPAEAARVRSIAREGEAPMVRTLVEYGYDPMQQDNLGCTALHIAALWAKHHSLEVMLSVRGIDTEAREKTGQTALHFAAKANNDSCVNALCHAGADPDAQDTEGRSPLHVASFYGRIPCLRALVENGANMEARTKHKHTPLHQAAAGGMVASVHALAQCGSDIGAVEAEGRTALHVAAFFGHPDVAEALVAVNVDVDARGRHGGTALFEAADRGEEATLQRLLALKADPSAVDDDRRTALHAAAFWGRSEIVGKLLAAGAVLPESDEEGRWLSQRAHFCLVRVSSWDDYNMSEEELQAMPGSAGDEFEVFTKGQAEREHERALSMLQSHCGKKNEVPIVQPVPPVPEYEVFNADAYRGEDLDLYRRTPASSARPSTAGTYLTSDKPSDDDGSWTGGEWSDDDFERDATWADPFDHMTVEWCQNQRKLWVTYVCGLDRLAKAHARGQGEYPYALPEVQRGIHALHALREILEFKNTRQAMPESCPVDQFGKALPENLSGLHVIMRPGSVWRYEYLVESCIPLPGVESWHHQRVSEVGRTSEVDRTMYCPITMEKLHKENVLFAPRRSPLIEDGRHYLGEAILAWLAKYPFCPVDRLPLTEQDLVPSSIQGLRMMQATNRCLEAARIIKQWRYNFFLETGSMWQNGVKLC